MGRVLLRRVLPGVVVVTVAVLAWALWPVDVEPQVAALADAGDDFDVEIVRDTLGRPHVRGARDVDVAHGLAWAHAEDDFETIQLSLLAARGDLATHLGLDGAANDYMVEFLRVREQVEDGWPRLTERSRAIADAYAEGLNLHAATNPDEVLPGLFPVDGRDVVAQAVHKSPLFFGLDEVLSALFAEGPLDLARHDVGAPVPRDPDADLGDLRHGSNTIAVAPERSADGATRLVVNSHQPWTGPVAWWQATVESDEGWHATGGLFPGVPAIVHGHNRDVAWAFTVNHPDLVDVFRLDVDPDDPDRYRVDGRWLELERREVPLRVNLLGRLQVTIGREALWSVFGPTVEREDGTYALRYAGMGAVDVGSTALFEQLHRLNRSTSVEDWLDAMRSQDGLPTFTAGVADRDGRIARVYNAMLPDRAAGHDWAGVVDGDTTDVLWDGYVPFDRLPHTIDPAAGWVHDANSSPFTSSAADDPAVPTPTDFPADTTGIERFETNRSLRLRQLLAADDDIDAAELRAIKLDTGYAPGSDLVAWCERLVALAPGDDEHQRKALDLLASWRGDAETDSRGMPVLAAVAVELEADEDVRLAPGRWVGTEVTDDQLVGAFQRGVAWLVEHHGGVDITWGELNRLRVDDVDLPVAGGPDTVRAIYGEPTDDGRLRGVAGDSFVQIVQWAADGALSSVSVHQFGATTDDPDAPHHDDQAPIFAAEDFTPTWFDEDDLAPHVAQRYRPGAAAP